MNRTHHLYQLQSLDSQIDKANQELAYIEAHLGESAELKQARQTADTAQQALRRIQTTLKDLELEVKSLSDKITNQEKLLYSGKALSAKEAANLQDEITSLKRWQSNREELLLETMVEAEDTEATFDKAQAALNQTEAMWRADQGDMIDKKASLQTQVAEWRVQRPNLTKSIDVDALSDYEDVRRKKAGVAVTAVKDGICQSCGMIPSSNKIRQAQSSAELVYCGGCGRILYIL